MHFPLKRLKIQNIVKTDGVNKQQVCFSHFFEEDLLHSYEGEIKIL